MYRRADRCPHTEHQPDTHHHHSGRDTDVDRRQRVTADAASDKYAVSRRHRAQRQHTEQCRQKVFPEQYGDFCLSQINSVTFHRVILIRIEHKYRRTESRFYPVILSGNQQCPPMRITKRMLGIGMQNYVIPARSQKIKGTGLGDGV